MRNFRFLPALISSAALLSAGSAGAQTAYYSYYGAAPPSGYQAGPPAGVVAQRSLDAYRADRGYWSPHNIRGFLRARPTGYDVRRADREGPPQSWKPTNLVPKAYYARRDAAVGGAADYTPETLAMTRAAITRYARILANGGWPRVPIAMRPGARGPAVATLRRRLMIEGDLRSAVSRGDPEVWTPDLTQAVKRFQARVGLPQSGIVEGATLAALNVSARARLRALEATAARLSALNFDFGPRYVVVNIPAEQVEAVDNGRVAGRYIAVVGAPRHRSPQLSVQAVAINLNPMWTVPDSIIKSDIIPKMRQDPGWLASARIRVIDHAGKFVNPSKIDWRNDSALNYTFRQDSGPEDALGQLRINMPNDDAVYMHDTNEKWLFKRAQRFLSHGCVRIKDVDKLAVWLLRGTPGAPDGRWTLGAITAGIATGKHITINLAHPIPVAWVYMTGWADANGVVHFRNDVYHKDNEAPDVARADIH